MLLVLPADFSPANQFCGAITILLGDTFSQAAHQPKELLAMI
jgi:hypothetical protein